MNRIKQYAAVLAVLLLWLGGCTGTGQEIPPQSGGETEEVNHMEPVVLTQEEEKLLCAAYINEDRIKQGLLYSYQSECLEQIRFGRDYLEEKYPGQSFELLSVRPRDKENENTLIGFLEQSRRETYYTLQISETENGYEAADTYYGVLLQAPYDAAVEELLQQAGFAVRGTYTNFSQAQGREIDGSLTAEELFALGARLGRDTAIFADGAAGDTEENKKLTESIRQVLLENNLYGSYCVYIGPGLPEQTDWGEYISVNGAEGLYKERFNCFELR